MPFSPCLLCSLQFAYAQNPICTVVETIHICNRAAHAGP